MTKHDNLAQEIKLVWSSQSELVNDFDRFDWRRLRMHVDQRQ